MHAAVQLTSIFSISSMIALLHSSKRRLRQIVQKALYPLKSIPRIAKAALLCSAGQST